VASPVTLRLDQDTRLRIARIARRKRVSVSAVIREAIAAWVEGDEATGSPYAAATDLIGVAHGGNPKRSTNTGRRLKELLQQRRVRS